MRKTVFIGALCGALLATFAAAEQPLAGGSPLRSLSTSDQGKGWDAVGRLNIGVRSFCTGAMIGADLVLTAAHCLFDARTGAMHDVGDVEFLAGWRNGRAAAYRGIRRGVLHPRYVFGDSDKYDRVAHDLALLQLDMPIRQNGIRPFATAARPRMGDTVGVVSYGQNRAQAPALQEACQVLAGQPGVVMLSCSVDFGSSGSPVFTFRDGTPEIVSVVSSKADMGARPVALGTSLDASLGLLRKRLADGIGVFGRRDPLILRLGTDGARGGSGAKFVRP